MKIVVFLDDLDIWCQGGQERDISALSWARGSNGFCDLVQQRHMSPLFQMTAKNAVDGAAFGRLTLPQLGGCGFFDLADSLSGNSELTADLFQGMALVH